MENLTKQLELIGLQAIELDVTNYLKKTLGDSEFDTFPNKEFSFSYDIGAIKYEGRGLWGSDNKPRVLQIDFYHDFRFSNGVEDIKTKMTFIFDEIESLIEDLFCYQIA